LSILVMDSKRVSPMIVSREETRNMGAFSYLRSD
jgi:hypothetical protein